MAGLMLLTAAGLPAATTEIRYLSGTGSADAVPWDFFCTSGNQSGVWTKIPVPSCWELQGFGTYDYGYDLRSERSGKALDREQGKYRLDFAVPAEWQGKAVQLVFDGSMTDTEAWVNGQPAGPVHQGSFYRFKYNITPLVKFGQTNRLEVTVSKESANASVNRAERRGDYWNFGGLFRPVYLEAVPPDHIEWTAINAQADGNFTVDVHPGPGLATAAQVKAQIYNAQDQPVGAPFAADLAPGQDKATLRTKVEDVKDWSAETPNLYTVRLTLEENGQPVHETTERFGFRTFEVRPGVGFFLNGRKIELRGVNRHSFWPETGRTLSKQICYDDVRLMKAMNMNAVRMSHYPPDADFLAACDELGLYVLDELGGWHGSYDTPTGAALIGEMVRRDVNHPAILFWDNGNEGGWNTANDGEFAKWDPQQRQVIHPWAKFGPINDPHYPTYDALQKLAAGPEIFTATEFLHGIYDGGAGAGLHDYWDFMRQAPNFGGAFIWALLDEAVVRTDQGGKLDARGSFAPDGIVGPHREKEGSYFTIRQIWSPVQVGPAALPADFNGTLSVENRYDFTNLQQCTFEWALAKFPAPGLDARGHTVVANGTLPGPDVAPHAQGTLKLPLASDWQFIDKADVLYVTAKDPQGQALWTWSWSVMPATAAPATASPTVAASKILTDEDGQLAISGGNVTLRFDRQTGELAKVIYGSIPILLGNGPRLVAYARQAKPNERKYADMAGPRTLTSLKAKVDGKYVVVTADYDGALKQATWRIAPDGAVELDYTYNYNGTVDLLGVNFDYPETAVQAITWLGWGPYRVWQNRMEGTTLDVWHNTYNDTIPGETWVFPEFKGYFRDWRWAVLQTKEGVITVSTDAAHSYLGIFTPRDGTVQPLLALPQTGLAFLDVIPAMRDKFKTQDQLGPQSQPIAVSGEHHGVLHFNFAAP